MPNRWVDHVKKFAADNNLSYACALSKPECKDSYRAKYGVSKKLTKKQNIEKMGAEDMDAPNMKLVVKEKKKRRPKELVIEEFMIEEQQKLAPTKGKNKQKVGDLEPREFSTWMNDKLPRKSSYISEIGSNWQGKKDKFGNWFAYFNSPFREIKLVRPNGEILDFDKDELDLTEKEDKFYKLVFNKISKIRKNYKLQMKIENHRGSEIDLFKYIDKLNLATSI
jgi:hypothetical protein